MGYLRVFSAIVFLLLLSVGYYDTAKLKFFSDTAKEICLQFRIPTMGKYCKFKKAATLHTSATALYYMLADSAVRRIVINLPHSASRSSR